MNRHLIAKQQSRVVPRKNVSGSFAIVHYIFHSTDPVHLETPVAQSIFESAWIQSWPPKLNMHLISRKSRKDTRSNLSEVTERLAFVLH